MPSIELRLAFSAITATPLAIDGFGTFRRFESIHVVRYLHEELQSTSEINRDVAWSGSFLKV